MARERRRLASSSPTNSSLAGSNFRLRFEPHANVGGVDGGHGVVHHLGVGDRPLAALDAVDEVSHVVQRPARAGHVLADDLLELGQQGRRGNLRLGVAVGGRGPALAAVEPLAAGAVPVLVAAGKDHLHAAGEMGDHAVAAVVGHVLVLDGRGTRRNPARPGPGRRCARPTRRCNWCGSRRSPATRRRRSWGCRAATGTGQARRPSPPRPWAARATAGSQSWRISAASQGAMWA